MLCTINVNLTWGSMCVCAPLFVQSSRKMKAVKMCVGRKEGVGEVRG